MPCVLDRRVPALLTAQPQGYEARAEHPMVLVCERGPFGVTLWPLSSG